MNSSLRRTGFFVGVSVLFLAWLLGLRTLAAFRLSSSPQPRQPLAFSHRLHAGQYRLECSRCHMGVNRSPRAGLPSAVICLDCHQKIDPDDEEGTVDLKTLAGSGKPVPWERIYKLAGHVYFNHQVHGLAGLKCVSCHGPVRQMDVLRQAVSLRMDWCVECHKQKGASRDCLACHQ